MSALQPGNAEVLVAGELPGLSVLDRHGKRSTNNVPDA